MKSHTKYSYLLHWMSTIKDLKHVKINNANLLYFIFSQCNGYFEEINKNKYLALVPINKSK